MGLVHTDCASDPGAVPVNLARAVPGHFSDKLQ